MPDCAGFDDPFRQEYPRLVRALGVAFGNRTDAEDAVQHAFARAFKRWRRVATYENRRAWLSRVALNRLIDQRRHQGAGGRMMAELDGHEPLDQAVVRVDLTTALRKLSTQQRTALCLFYIADLTLADIAASMQISNGTAKWYLHEGRTRLRAAMEPQR